MSTAGRYKHVVKLGEGTYGSVYKGTEIQTGKVVAFKRMVVTSDDEGVPGAAIREICLLKELRHDNVVDLFEVLFEPPKITMIFELCDCDLKRFMESRPKRLLDAEAEMRPILKQIFIGLEYLHSRNVVHRDMKPQTFSSTCAHQTLRR
ncbi:protein_kinase (plasmid) [Leishmania braziliensis MHOM/BR/75/M2904]|uniref:Protein_kinase n=1 Tax=Leishmania braziliensis MHOM/BR/75/M2904 TaxID=420245 RepID=A0A3P3Z2E0_LEIBR|nr:protein_kinase [Leishmania braziliensis MHOM/BR/75/M2904]